MHVRIGFGGPSYGPGYGPHHVPPHHHHHPPPPTYGYGPHYAGYGPRW